MSRLEGIPDSFMPHLGDPQERYRAWSREPNKHIWWQMSPQKKLLPLSNEELKRMRELNDDPEYGKGQ
jgi:hypothetical protein